MLEPKNKTEVSLQNKLQHLANGEDIELTNSEAFMYGVDVMDVLPNEDF